MILTRDTGRTVTLSGTTAAARPELAGLVIQDRLRPFASSGTGEPPVNGVLQERIVRSSVDNTLAFYYRIKELQGGIIRYIAIRFWPDTVTAVDVDYRIDGLGDVGPEAVIGPEPIRFDFYVAPTPAPVTEIALSRFMFLKMIPGKGFPVVTEHNTSGQIIIGDERWAVTLSDSFAPVV